MREFAVPPVVTVPDDDNTLTALWDAAENHPSSILFMRSFDDGATWQDVTSVMFREQVVAAAKGLAAAGIQPGDRVALMSATRYEWTLLDYAIWAAGAVTVTIYETSSADQAKFIIEDSGAVAAIVEDAEMAEMVEGLGTQVKHVWTIDGAPGAIEALDALGADAGVDIEERRTSRKADDLATIVYTSGTTGRPKGCMLTHRNLLADIRNIIPEVPGVLFDGARMLLFLSLAHVLARILQLAGMESRTTIAHADRTKLTAIMPVVKPTTLLAIPRVFEKVYAGAYQKALDGGKGAIFEKAAACAKEYSRALDKPGGPGLALKLRHKLFDMLVYGKIRAAIGGECNSAVSGGAALGPELGHFFRGIGVTIYEGYGLTETSPVLSLNLQTAIKVGSIGRPTPGTALRIAEDGELQAKGPQVFPGYWNNDAATAEVLDADGWFSTGDIAEIDDDGYVTITGRKKDIIVTAGGKNVAPGPLEKILDAHPLIAYAMVVGEGRPYIGCLISLDGEMLRDWLTRHDKDPKTPISDLTEDPELLAELQAKVDEANKTVSRAEQIKQFRVMPVELSEDAGEITPSVKVKRHVVMEKYSNEINALYDTAKARRNE
ncbi:AMP-dependent synthetase/ligase [Glycomyces niveus]|uniref:Long-chain fatty acid--CoA ligase n=1 Tax=Glycomyces niveus TaxID=2820287 RepID=A0ABS3TYZ2_9ACTN|nr:long-chain fatty acid--CoA ligase [Glycomyces sp. NEAU-S30]MBO3731251.1 long-chain fatty acid--CoA ligase [Glycomyces sp. NEAU-S30]